MMSKRTMLEFFLLAKLMSLDEGVGLDTYRKCKDFLLSDMFLEKKNKWVFEVIVEMYEKGFTMTCEDDIVKYLDQENKVPKDKLGSIACWLIEIYLQFCNMTRPVTGVEFTVVEAIDELIKLSGLDEWEMLKN